MVVGTQKNVRWDVFEKGHPQGNIEGLQGARTFWFYDLSSFCLSSLVMWSKMNGGSPVNG